MLINLNGGALLISNLYYNKLQFRKRENDKQRVAHWKGSRLYFVASKLNHEKSISMWLHSWPLFLTSCEGNTFDLVRNGKQCGSHSTIQCNTVCHTLSGQFFFAPILCRPYWSALSRPDWPTGGSQLEVTKKFENSFRASTVTVCKLQLMAKFVPTLIFSFNLLSSAFEKSSDNKNTERGRTVLPISNFEFFKELKLAFVSFAAPNLTRLLESFE